MRELLRYRAEFNDCHSLRSKLILTNSICTDVNALIKVNGKIIRDEQRAMESF